MSNKSTRDKLSLETRSTKTIQVIKYPPSFRGRCIIVILSSLSIITRFHLNEITMSRIIVFECTSILFLMKMAVIMY